MSPLIAYVDRKFSTDSLAVIDRANAIIAEYTAQGFDLTLRQLYYQFVARGLIPNRDSEYKRLGSIVNDGRLAGLIDWDAIEDRTRNLRSLPHWQDPTEIMHAISQQFRRDLWRNQKYRPEVWIEKEALAGVIEGACNELDTPHFALRGYNSQSEQWRAGQRFSSYIAAGQTPIIFHLGDHDPSGIDMTRDNEDRLFMFTGGIEVRRLALNMDQVQRYNPPPNPAKIKDSRAINYIRIYGRDSWELDALEPQVLADLIRDAIATVRNDALWEEDNAEIQRERALLEKVARRWKEIEAFVDGEVP